LNPTCKLKAFQGAAWTGDKINWSQHYLKKFKKVFDYYRKKYPDIEVEAATASNLTSLDKAFLQSKRRRLSPSHENMNENWSTSSYAELERYLQERKSFNH
jgi:hypothetical protein